MLGLAEGTCKAQVHRARQLLRERLERGLGHAGGAPRITGERP
jgi:DNA-directed RNA polymerase specialized sigma24 family protein